MEDGIVPPPLLLNFVRFVFDVLFHVRCEPTSRPDSSEMRRTRGRREFQHVSHQETHEGPCGNLCQGIVFVSKIPDISPGKCATLFQRRTPGSPRLRGCQTQAKSCDVRNWVEHIFCISSQIRSDFTWKKQNVNRKI